MVYMTSRKCSLLKGRSVLSFSSSFLITEISGFKGATILDHVEKNDNLWLGYLETGRNPDPQ